jgi:hypothetical protein
MSFIKNCNHDYLMERQDFEQELMDSFENTVYLENVKTGEIKTWAEWEKAFDRCNDPCKWYKCNHDFSDEEAGDDDSHPKDFSPGDCFLVEVEYVGYDRDMGEIWQRV